MVQIQASRAKLQIEILPAFNADPLQITADINVSSDGAWIYAAFCFYILWFCSTIYT